MYFEAPTLAILLSNSRSGFPPSCLSIIFLLCFINALSPYQCAIYFIFSKNTTQYIFPYSTKISSRSYQILHFFSKTFLIQRRNSSSLELVKIVIFLYYGKKTFYSKNARSLKSLENSDSLVETIR